MTLLRILLLMVTAAALPAAAQDQPLDFDAPLRDTTLQAGSGTGANVRPPDAPVYEDATVPPAVQARPETGGNSTLDDILRRQRGEILDTETFRNTPEATGQGATDRMATGGPLGTRGGASDPELWRGVRFDAQDLSVSARGPATDVLIQDGGMQWLEIRRGPLPFWGGLAMVGMVALLAVFYVLAGRVKIEDGKAGRTLTRFKGVERFGHWLLSGSFILLALTGLFSLFGRKVLIPAFGHEIFAASASVSKWIHDNVSWAFIVGLVLVFVMWVWENLPDRTDLTWIRYGGGFVGSKHPPAKKFNFGQKIVFWSVIVLGSSIAVSGLALLFPFELQLFAPTFEKINALGLPQLLGFGPIDTALAPQEEMALSQLWHAIVGFALMTIIIAHIYIGSLGMEGAFDAMGNGQVDENWAEQHHSIWAEEKKAEERGAGTGAATPAE